MVGTVGRVLDLIQRASLILHSCRFVVLDEADEMLDLGFLEDVERILTITPNSRQTALFSATMPPPIRELADRYLYDPVTVKVKSATLTVDSVEQFSVDVKSGDKAEKLVDVLRAERPDQAIVFTRTKIRCDQLFRRLRDRGLNVKALHGDMSQGQRDGVMLAFKGGRLPILVATDVAARGLDISTVTHVVNFDVPTSPDAYVHRIGRTGRVGRAGRAITFVEPRQQRELEAIERHIGTGITPWAEGARTTPAPVAERPRRHSKPHISRDGDEPQAKLVAGVGRAEGVEVADLVHAVTERRGHRRRGGARRARARALLASSASRSARPSASSRRSTARRSTAPRCASRSRAPEPLAHRPQPRLGFARCVSVCNPGHVKLLEAEPVLAPEAAPQAPPQSPPEQPASPPEADRDVPRVRRADGARAGLVPELRHRGARPPRRAPRLARRLDGHRADARCWSSAPSAPATPP